LLDFNYYFYGGCYGFKNIKIRWRRNIKKKSREVTNIDRKIKMILDDMAETMYEKEGIGLAAPQIGILKDSL